VGLDHIVFGFAAMDGPPIEGMPADKGDTLLRTQVSQPIPGKHTLNGHDEALAVRGNGREKGLRSGCHVAVQQDVSIATHDAHVHAPSVPIKTTVKLVLLGVEAHEVSSSSVGCLPNARIPGW
jgi:hypothetical protein